ncbi:hypothetical protein [uncultured Ramlibacter sp.]|uniref:hypothetical protein n=1 Tax=uncultured Ramlibacter sp. TaxID=260755 RepID=UPI0026195323|nr:hypothetical protein [uncultured Ramlibacter sp.]
MKNLSNWRSVRLWETGVERGLRERHTLWLHGWCIGAIVLGTMWAASHLQMLLGSGSLALRYCVTLGIGYLVYLLVLRLWASALLRKEEGSWDGPDLSFNGGGGGSPARVEPPPMQSGGGGDFGGGGASADFSGGDAAADLATGALEVAAGSDEGAVVVVPVVAVFLVGLALLFGAGSLLLLYFGWEALLAVAVELSFTYVASRTVNRVAREGWLTAAVRLTWKPLLGALACAVLLGATIDHFIPSADSLPQAIKAIRFSSAASSR